MHPKLEGAVLKLGRAHHYLVAVNKMLGEYQLQVLAAQKAQADAASRGVPMILQNPTPPSKEWAVLVGEFVHNVRSGLDYVVYELIGHQASASVRRRFERDIQFPIYLTEKRWDAHLRPTTYCGKTRKPRNEWMLKLTEECRAYLSGLQPYQAGEQSAVNAHPIAILQRLSNIDKHRTLNVVFLDLPADMSFVTDMESLRRVRHMESQTGIGGADRSDDPEMDVKVGLPFQVAFEDGTPLTVLPGIYNFAAMVVNQCDADFFS